MARNRKSKEMWEFSQRMMAQYTDESDGANGVKHTRKLLHPRMSQADFQDSLDEARQLSVDIAARCEGSRAAGTDYYCLSCENGYDRPAGRGYNQACPHCSAEHCSP